MICTDACHPDLLTPPCTCDFGDFDRYAAIHRPECPTGIWRAQPDWVPDPDVEELDRALRAGAFR